MKEYKSYSKEFFLKSENQNFKKVKILTSNDAYKYALNFYHDDIEIYESVFVILLNNASNTIGYAKISQGGITSSIVDKRIVCKYAIDSLANSVILIHNHPSGVNSPSREDNNITQSTNKALECIGVKMLDHIIITKDNGYYSYSDEGLL